MRAFTSRRITGLSPEIAVLCHNLIDQFPSGPFDLLAAYGEKIPVIIIARLLGVPESLWRDLLKWSHAMVSMYRIDRTRAVEDAAITATQDFSTFLTDYITQRRNSLGDDLISELIQAEQDGERLSTPELISTCILLLNAGHEATVHAIGNGVKTILESNHNPAHILGPDTLDQTIEETLRYDPPLHLFERHAKEDMTLWGHRFKRGDTVALLLAAANRDPLLCANPQMFDPTRPAAKNMSFGAGVHFCVGAPLARLEMAQALPILFERYPGLALTEPPRYAPTYHFHGLKSLMVCSKG